MAAKSYRVLNEIRIDKQALISNYKYFQKINPQAKIAPVLKANAYGHGLQEVASVVDEELSAPFICVDSLYEAYELEKGGVKTPILIMGYTNPQNYDIAKSLPFNLTVFDASSLLALNKYQPGAKIHIKLDTGMCRLGLQKADLPAFIKTLKKCSDLDIVGIFSHLSQADNPGKITFTNRQISAFKEMVTMFESEGFGFKWKHISASSGASFIRDPYFNLIRLGLGFYGYTPFGAHTKDGREGRKNLKPALELSTHIAQIKDIPIGSLVGYGGTHKALQKETIAILPLGYNEAVPRRLSNVGVFTLKDVPCEVVGNVSMDMTMIRLPRGVKAKVGDEVKIISRDVDSPNSIYRLSQKIHDIEYTILTGLNPTIRRTVI